MHQSKTLQTAWVALGSLSSIAFSLVSAVILSRYLSKDDYGTYKQIVFTYNTLLIVFSAGLPKVYSYFLPRFEMNEGESIVLKVNRMLFCFGLVLSLLMYFFSDEVGSLLNNPQLPSQLRLFSVVPALMLPTLGIEGVFSAYTKTIYIAIYNTLSRFLMLICLVLPILLFGPVIEYALYGWCISSFFVLLLALYFKKIPFRGLASKTKADLDFKDILRYSIPLMFASVWGIAIKTADQFYVSRYFGTKVFADYSNGFTELPFVSMITASVSIVLMPIFSKHLFENKVVDKLIATWKSVLTKSALLIYPMVFFCMYFAEEVMILLYTQEYSASGAFFRINMFLNFFNIIMFSPLFLSLGRSNVYALVHLLIAFAVWVTMYFVVTVYRDPVSVAITSTVFQIFKILIFVFLIARYLKVKLLDLFPFRILAKIFSQNMIGLLILFFLSKLFGYSNVIQMLSVNFCFYFIYIMSTGPLFGYNYRELIAPIFLKFKKQ